MKFAKSVMKILAPLAALASGSAYAHGPAPEEPILIENVSFKGTGCADESTASVNISEDKQAFTVTFSEFLAEAGVGIPASASRKNCALTLDLDIPAGWQFSIADFNFRGFMTLDQGISAEHSATYFLQGDPKQLKFASTNKGPFSEDYVYTDTIGIGSQVWSACGIKRALSINTAIRVWNTNKIKFPTAAGLITNDSIDGEITQVWGLTWRKCFI
jgi:hypothetical protein